MKFTTVSVLALGATLTGVLSAPVDLSGVENVSKPMGRDPYWCGSPFCDKVSYSVIPCRVSFRAMYPLLILAVGEA